MIRLEKSLRAWGKPDFAATLKLEVAELGGDELPLQQGLSLGSYVTADTITVVINSVAETEQAIRVRAGIFYQSVISGCSCDNDPTPTGENTEYCEVQLDIDKVTAVAAATLVD